MPTVRILIADDHEIVRRGLRLLIASRPDWQVCGEAEDGDEAIHKAKQLHPDVILLDVSMPRMNGLDAAPILKREVPDSAILIVSQNDPSIMRARALEVGATGYVAKSDLSRDLLPAIERIVGDSSSATRPTVAVERRELFDTRYFLQAGGEVGALMRALDWSKTKLGPAEQWQQSLKTCVSICLKSRAELLIWWGPDLVILYNDAYSRTLAAKHPSALGKPGKEVWGEIWDVIGPMLERVTTTGEATWSDDLLLLLERHGYPEETYHTFSYTPIPDDHGNIGGVFTPVTETTEKVISERRLRTLRDLGARSVDARSEPEAWRIAADVLSANPYDIPCAILYRIDSDGMKATAMGFAGIDPAHEFFPSELSLEETQDLLGKLVDEAVKCGKPAEITLTDDSTNLPGGIWGVSPRELIALPLSQTGQARPLGVLVAGVNRRKLLDDTYRTFFDLTSGQIAKSVADAQAYEQERKRAEALAELDRAKTAFFSNVSHEFRTPLTLMLGPIEDLLERPEELSPDTQRQLVIAHRNSLRLLKLVNSLLDFSRIEAGRVQAHYVPTDLAKLTAEVASVFRSAMEKAGLDFEVSFDQAAGSFYVDHDMWEKIVLNLISNAFKYTLAGGVYLTLREEDGFAELKVRDTGTGIPENELPRLFERFHRVEGALGRTHEGTGIGLALVQELVKLHGGSVRVESELNTGSAFFVTIPAGSAHLPPDRVGVSRDALSTGLRSDSYVEEALRWLPPEAGGESEVAVATASLGNSVLTSIRAAEGKGQEVILLADDNADMRDYVRRLLSEKYSVHAVSNGEEAVRAAQELIPDLILTDVMMPKLDGFGVLRTIRENANTKSTPVILLSARAGEESRVEGLQAGADDYLVKPFTARELLARVGAHLKMARIRQEAGDLEKSLRSELELRVSERTAELERAEAGLRALSGRLLQAQDEERRRIARELHDSAGQLLAALSMTLSPLQMKLNKQDAELSRPVTESLQMINELSQELRTLSHLLHPPLLDEAGLPSALRWYVEGFAERSKIPVDIEVDSELDRLPAEMETTIFRIVQESLTNIHRHSSSPTARIKISCDPDHVSLEIRDQGKGMPASMDRNSFGPLKPGVGIQGMRERVRQLGGTFRIETGTEGTLVLATLPVSSSQGHTRQEGVGSV